MAKITTILSNTTEVVHNNTQGLNDGDYIHLTQLEKDKFDAIQDITQYTDELAQDAIGSILTDSSTIDITYDDVTPIILADVKLNSIDATHLSDTIDTSTFVNDGDDGINPFISAQELSGYVPYTGAITNVNLGEFQLKSGQIEFDQTPTQTQGIAKLRWNDADGTIELGLKGGNVTLQIGQEQVIRIVNKTGFNLLEGNYQCVYSSGAQGQRMKVELAQANTISNSNRTIGLVTENINNNQEGFITTSGLIRGVNTTGSLQGETWVDGDILYLSTASAGELTNILPTSPSRKVVVGYVISSHITQGSIFVSVNTGLSIDEIHDVEITGTTLNKVIGSTTEGIWENKTIDSILGYTPENVANKQNSLIVDGTGTKYATVDAVNGGIIQKNYIPSVLTNWKKKLLTSASTAKIILLGDSTSDQAGNFFPAVESITNFTRQGRPLDGVQMSNVPNFGSNGNTISSLWSNKTQVKGLDAVIAQNPDLVVFSYGINDIRINALTKDQLKTHIIDCINYLKASLPNCDFVLRMPNSFVAGLNQGYIFQGSYATQSLAAQGQTDILYNAYKELDKYWDDVILFNTQDKIYGRICPTTTILMTDEIHPEYLSMLNELVKIIGVEDDFKKERAKAATAINYPAPWNVYNKSLDLDINFIKILDGVSLGQALSYVDLSVAGENMNKYSVIPGDIVSMGDDVIFKASGGSAVSAGQFRVFSIGNIPTNSITGTASVKIYRHKYNNTQAQEIYFMDKVNYPYIHRISISILNDTQLIVNQIIDDDLITGKIQGLIPDNLQLSPTDILLVEGQSPLTLTGVSISPFQPTNAIMSISTGGFNALGSPTYAYIVGNHGYEGQRSNSPAFTGTPTAPTATLGTNSTQLASTAFVQSTLKSKSGWANYSTTTYTSVSPFSIAPSTTVTLPNDANNSIITDLPLGVTSFYNGTTNKITPPTIGDSYIINVRFKAKTTTNNDYLTLYIDIGSGDQINAESRPFLKGANTEQSFNFTLPIYTLSTFVTNGGLIKINSNLGTITIYDITFFITRNYTR